MLIHDFALARYTANGTLDSSFGENGIVTTDFNNLDDYANSIALQGDKIIVAGSMISNGLTLPLPAIRLMVHWTLPLERME